VSDETDREAALLDLTLRVQPDIEPSIDPDTLDQILDSAQRASTWTPETPYALGAVVMPETRNGHRYEAIQGGTSDVSVPTFPVGDEATVSDATVIWKEVGREFGNVYDVKLAENLVWKWRRATLSESGKDEADMYEHCEKEEKRTAPIVFA
jgi:hypothetical protein